MSPFDGNGIYALLMVVHIHLLKQGIEVVHVHPTSQGTYASRSRFVLILRGHRVPTATEMVGINLGRVWGTDICGGSMGLVVLGVSLVSCERLLRDSGLRCVAGDSIRKLCGTSPSASKISCKQLSSRTLGRSIQVLCGRRSAVGAWNVADETLEFD